MNRLAGALAVSRLIRFAVNRITPLQIISSIQREFHGPLAARLASRRLISRSFVIHRLVTAPSVPVMTQYEARTRAKNSRRSDAGGSFGESVGTISDVR